MAPRPTIFGSKDGGERYQGVTTHVGSLKFEAARERLSKLAGWPLKRVSDGDTMEYLSRGHEATVIFLEKQKGKRGEKAK